MVDRRAVHLCGAVLACFFLLVTEAATEDKEDDFVDGYYSSREGVTLSCYDHGSAVRLDFPDNPEQPSVMAPNYYGRFTKGGTEYTFFGFLFNNVLTAQVISDNHEKHALIAAISEGSCMIGDPFEPDTVYYAERQKPVFQGTWEDDAYRVVIANNAGAISGKIVPLIEEAGDKTFEFTGQVRRGNLETSLAAPEGQLIFRREGDHLTQWFGKQAVRKLSSAKKPRLQLIAHGGHTGAIISVALSPDNRLLATGSQDGSVRLWEAKTGRQLRVHREHTGPIYKLQFSNDSARLLTFAKDDSLTFEVQSGRQIRRLAHTDRSISTSVGSMSPDESLIALGGPHARLNQPAAHALAPLALYRADGRLVRHFEDADDPGALDVSFSADGRNILTGGVHAARLWDVETGTIKQQFSGSSGAFQVAMSDNGRSVATVDFERSAILWDVRSGEQIRTFGTSPDYS